MNGPLFELIGAATLGIIPAICLAVAYFKRSEAWSVAPGIAGAALGLGWMALLCVTWDAYAHYLGGFPK